MPVSRLKKHVKQKVLTTLVDGLVAKFLHMGSTPIISTKYAVLEGESPLAGTETICQSCRVRWPYMFLTVRFIRDSNIE
jgi:hypothetical protein